MKYKSLFILSVALPMQWLLVRWVSKYPLLVETYYSQGLYPKIMSVLQGAFGWIPFPIGDIFYFILGIWIIYLMYKLIQEWRIGILKNVLRLTATASVLYFVFHLFWALNYYRLPLYQNMDMASTYSTEDLYKTTKKLIANTNSLHRDLAFADSLVVSAYTKKEIRKMASQGYKQIPKTIIPNKNLPNPVKNSLFSLSISYLGYGGYFNPFTGEAQVNAKTPEALYAVIAAHEQAHQLGYAAENEANFLGVLASIQNSDSFIQYAGYTYGLRYCLNELARRDKDLYKELHESIQPGVLALYKSHHLFWKQYDTVIENISKEVWDKVLKISKQSDGVASYSYIVALLVNFDKSEPNFLL